MGIFDDLEARAAHQHGHSHGHDHSPGHSHGPTVTEGSHPGHGVSPERGFVEEPHLPARTQAELTRGAGRGKILFLQLVSGIAGDMTIAALLDLGVPLEVVEQAVQGLGLGQVELRVRRGYAGAIGCTHFAVEFPEQQQERSYKDIVELISKATLAPPVQQLALRIFECLARAEAQVHNTTLAAVHFHEVGAIDSIVDIVGAAAALEFLGADVVATPVPLGSGWVHCRHGVLPLPAPATVNCLVGVPTVSSGLETELVTPTGAAIIATTARDFAPWFALRPLRIGWGAGTKGLPDRPNALRAILGEAQGEVRSGTHVVLEANVDDMTGEVAGHALSQVLAAGALDCWITPITMKKGRPGFTFSALSTIEQASCVSDCMLRETTTLGVRQSLVNRYELERKVISIETPFGTARVKVSQGSSVESRVKPELDDCVRIAQETGLPLVEVVQQVLKAALLNNASKDNGLFQNQ